MRFLVVQIGCSGVIAVVAFVIGLACSLFATDATWTSRLTMAAIPSAIAFVSALLLSSRDSAEHFAIKRSVRAYLLSCNEASDEQFLSAMSFDDAELLLETRKAISQYFNVPSTKVHRGVHLISELHVNKLDPSFQFHVIDSVIASQSGERMSFAFAMADLESIDDLAKAIRKVLDGFEEQDDRV